MPQLNIYRESCENGVILINQLLIIYQQKRFKNEGMHLFAFHVYLLQRFTIFTMAVVKRTPMDHVRSSVITKKIDS